MAVPGAVLDRSAVRSEETTATAADGHRVPLHLARPAHPQDGSVPGIVVIAAAFGVTDHIRDICSRFAAQGFVAAAPELYARVEGGPPTSSNRDEIIGRLKAMGDAGATHDLRATAALLRADGQSNRRVACIGFCMGGRLALLLAADSGTVDRAIDCWGGRITARTAPVDDLHPVIAVDRVPEIRCPFLGVFGAEDENPGPTDVEELRAAPELAEVDHHIVVYEAAGHALFADNQPSYREGPAHQAWGEFLRFLEPLRSHQGGDPG